jgi:tetratricopeptide (TPR) repeat protein
MGLGKNDEAAEILKKVVVADPLNGRALIQLGQHMLKEAKKLDDQEGDAAKEKALEFEAQAIGYFESAAKIAKFKVEALSQHAQVLVIRRKEYGAAVKMLEEAQRTKYRDNVEKFLTEVRKAAEYQEATRKAKASEKK